MLLSTSAAQRRDTVQGAVSTIRAARDGTGSQVARHCDEDAQRRGTPNADGRTFHGDGGDVVGSDEDDIEEEAAVHVAQEGVRAVGHEVIVNVHYQHYVFQVFPQLRNPRGALGVQKGLLHGSRNSPPTHPQYHS